MLLQIDIQYADHEKGWLDVMAPDGDGPFPVVVCIHGGGWQGGAKDDMHVFAEWLLSLGIAAVIPNYRLTDAAPHPAQEQDILASLEWMVDHANEFGFDVGRVGLTGVSAGGHLTAQIGTKASRNDDARFTVRCMYPLCPPTDMAAFALDNPDIRNVLEALAGGPLEERVGLMRDASPIAHVHAGAPACCCVHGDSDGLVPCSQSVMFADALRAAGVPAEAVLVPGVDHAAYQPDSEPAEPLGGLDRYLAFFREHLSNSE